MPHTYFCLWDGRSYQQQYPHLNQFWEQENHIYNLNMTSYVWNLYKCTPSKRWCTQIHVQIHSVKLPPVWLNVRVTTVSSGTSSSRARSNTGQVGGNGLGGSGSTARFTLLLSTPFPSSTDPPRAFSSRWAWVMSTGKPSRIQPDRAGTCLVRSQQIFHRTLSTLNKKVRLGVRLFTYLMALTIMSTNSSLGMAFPFRSSFSAVAPCIARVDNWIRESNWSKLWWDWFVTHKFNAAYVTLSWYKILKVRKAEMHHVYKQTTLTFTWLSLLSSWVSRSKNTKMKCWVTRITPDKQLFEIFL